VKPFAILFGYLFGRHNNNKQGTRGKLLLLGFTTKTLEPLKIDSICSLLLIACC